MAPIKLYKMNGSSASRAVLMTAKSLNIKFEEIDINLLTNEQLNPDYIKVNPLHTIPTLNDDGRIICDSHAINAYLLDEYGKDDFLYPRNVYKRALVNEKLIFDSGVLFPILREIDRSYVEKRITSLSPKMIQDTTTAYKVLEMLLQGKNWIALDNITIADFSCYATVTSLDYHLAINPEMYPNLSRWISSCQNNDWFAEDSDQLKAFKCCLKSLGATTINISV